MPQNMSCEEEAVRPDCLSRMPYSEASFYRTLSLAPTVYSENFSTPLKIFISVFNSSQVCRTTLKDRLRQIVIQGACKTWNPSSCSISPRNLFKQDFKQDSKPSEPAPRLSSRTSLPVTPSVHTADISLSAFLSDSTTSSSALIPSNTSNFSDIFTPKADMCFKYKCDACKNARYDFCQDYLQNEEDRKWCKIEVEKPWGGLLKRCQTCETITGAIKELKALVFREPWLVTEGMAGAPEKAAWEKEGGCGGEGGEEEKAAGVVVVDDDDDTPDGFTKEERDQIRREAEEAVMRRWGLMRAEQAAEEEADKAE